MTLSREVLDWAADKAGYTLQSFADSIAKRDADRQRIAAGQLTSAQVAKLAKKAKVPFGYLFLEKPPEIKQATIPDLRQVQNAVPLSDDFYEVLEDVMAKQQWYAEYLSESGERALPFVGRFASVASRKVPAIVADMRQVMKLSDEDRRTSADATAYFSKLSAKAEAVGILVIKTSFVKAATKRALSEKEFRGFALSHPTAPVVFVNGRDAEVAAIFTLMHELAHIWLGITGVTDLTAKPASNVERICNAVAGELLVPSADFAGRWNSPEDLQRLASYYRVSKLVIARRALDSGYVDQDFYDEVANAARAPKKPGKPTALLTIPVRNSKRFTRTVVAEAMSGQTLLREAASLLNVRPDTVVALAKGRVKNG
ncbi:ImmA/IrrE family metallo-endopeptidase [Luteimonas sp. 9C]|uniref:ImmA/IrrE family metallo-endopeptidase n=1 Tax=Luteimonas sp. 9C TaxID=2653148 RepID=UPI00135C08F2|nr:ImmA/IrrE family metallo-endopeptidase [Luteimonas sp. 9C]